MKYLRRYFTKAILYIFFFLLFSFHNFCFAQDGQALFRTYCASCHKADEEFTGPPLKGAREREPSEDWVYKWIANVDGMIATDPYAKQLFATYKSKMTLFRI